MREKLFFSLVVMFLLQLGATDCMYAQEVNKCSFGVSFGLTSERFGVTRNFNAQNKTVSTQAYKAKSWSNYGGALWSERKLSVTWSLIPKLGYQFVHIKDNVVSGGLSKSGSGDDIKETHHYASAALHLRKYFSINSKLSLFVDAGVKADRMVCFKNEYWRYKNETWNPKISNNINPAIVLAAGLRRGRWALSAEYQYFLRTPIVKKYRGNLETSGIETNLERQNLAVKMAFTVFK